MTESWITIALAGLAGALGLTVVMAVGTALRMARLNFPMLLGSMLQPPGPRALLIGLIWHLVNGIIFAALYALSLGLAGIQPDWGVILALGVFHFAIAGLLLWLIGRVHPRIRQGHMPAPRSFGTRYGARGVILLLLAHVAYAAIVAAAFLAWP